MNIVTVKVDRNLCEHCKYAISLYGVGEPPALMVIVDGIASGKFKSWPFHDGPS